MCLNPLQILSLLIFKLSYLWSMKTQAVWLPHCCLFGVVILSLVYLFIEVIRLFPTAFNMYFYIHYWHSTVRWIFLFSTFVYCLFHYVSMDLWFFKALWHIILLFILILSFPDTAKVSPFQLTSVLLTCPHFSLSTF